MDIGARSALLMAATVFLVAFLLIYDREGDGVVRPELAPPPVIAPPAPPRAPAAASPVTLPRATPDSSALPPLKAVAARDARPDGRGLVHLARPGAGTLNGHAVRQLTAVAISAKDYQPALGAMAGQQNGLILFTPTEAVATSVFRRDRRPVFLNSGNGRVEIVSGTLLVKLKSMDQITAVAQRHRLNVLTQNDDISRAYYRVPEGFNLSTDLTRLRTDPDVADVEVEVLGGRVGIR